MNFIFSKHKFGLILYFTNTRLAPILYFTNTRLVKQILPVSQHNQRTDWITICILSNLVFDKYNIEAILYLANTRLNSLFTLHYLPHLCLSLFHFHPTSSHPYTHPACGSPSVIRAGAPCALGTSQST